MTALITEAQEAMREAAAELTRLHAENTASRLLLTRCVDLLNLHVSVTPLSPLAADIRAFLGKEAK